MTDFDLAHSTIVEISRALADGVTSAMEIVDTAFARIEKLDPALNAFVCLTRERAYEEAGASDERRAKGASIGPLDGIPYAVKDIYNVAGLATMAGSRMLSDNVAERDCTAVRKLSSAGMILLGKTHTVQFAASINGVNADFGTPHNPWSEIPHLPGGSSSGSAVAVAAGMVPMALGSDTGGSIRLPAALTGITGFKPTSGRLGRGGVRPLAWSLDTIGPLTRSVFDAALVFKVMQGFDSEDETTWTVAPIDSLDEVEKAIKGMRLVVCDTAFFDNCDPDVIKAVEEVAATLSELGATVSRDAIPEIEDAARLKSDGVIFPAEAYAVNQKLYDEHRDAIDPEVRYVAGGKDVSMPAYYWEMRERFHVQSRYVERMKDVDAILAPTSAFPAWPLEKFEAGERPPVAYSRNTMIGNILNLSSISVSCGFTSDGLPIGAMISTRPYDDLKALRLAHAYQHATSWHTKRPDLSWID